MTLPNPIIALTKELGLVKKQVDDLQRRLSVAPLNAGAAKITTIVGGEIFATRPWIRLIPESGTADVLNTILNVSDGKMIVIANQRDGDTITINPYTVASGNIDLLGDTVPLDIADTHTSLTFIYNEETTHWELIKGYTVIEWDEIDGIPADFPPSDHAPTHLEGGSDALTTTTPVADGVPQANGAGKLANGWLDATLEAIGGLTGAADKGIYFTGVDAADLFDLSAFARTLIDDIDAATARATLGLVAGGAGDIWVEKAGDTMTGDLTIKGAVGGHIKLHRDDTTVAATNNIGFIDFESVDASLAASPQVVATIRALAGAGGYNTGDAPTIILFEQMLDGTEVLAETARIDENGALILRQIIQAASASGLHLRDDGSNLGLAVLDGGYVISGDLTTVTEIYTGFLASTPKVIELGEKDASSGLTFPVGLVLTNNKTTGGDLIGSIYFANLNTAGAEKRIAQIGVLTGTDKDDGLFQFALSKDGVLFVAAALDENANLQLANNGSFIGDIVRALDASGLSLRDDGGNVALMIEDGGKIVVVGTDSHVEPFTGFDAQGNPTLILRYPTAHSTPTPAPTMMFANNQTDTTSGLLASIVWMNEAIGAAEKRVAVIDVQTDASVDSGKINFYVLGAGGVVATAQTILSSGRVGINNSAPAAQLDVIQTLTTGEALRILRNLTAASTDSPVVSIIQDHASDDQIALSVRQDGSGRIAHFTGTATLPRLAVEGTATSGATAGITLDLIVNNAGTPTVIGYFVGTASTWTYGTRPALSTDLSNYQSGGVGLRVALGPIAFYQGNADGDLSPEVARFASGVLLIGVTSGGASVMGVEAGTSGNDAAVGGTLYVDTAQSGNITTGEDNLILPAGAGGYSVPANTLAVNGQSLWFEAWGSTANNANNKTLRIRFGSSGTNLIATKVLSDNQPWSVRGRIVRTGAATQKAYVEITTGPNKETFNVTTLNQTLSGAVLFRITGEATATNDILIQSVVVGYDDANT